VSRRIDLSALPAGDEARLAAALAAASLACFPTDTVYGLGGRLAPVVGDAIARVKGRAVHQPLQVVFPTVELLVATVGLPPAVAEAVRRLLPGPYTLVVPYPEGFAGPPPGLAEWPDGGAIASLGVRVPAWPTPARALAALPFPLLASSANLSGGADPASLDAVAPAVRDSCDLLLDGGPVSGVSSSVLDLTRYGEDRRWRVLRRGAVTPDDIASRLTGPEG
jgi:L-threonylcarbamoyladenylate synthase